MVSSYVDKNGNYVYTDESGKVTTYNPDTEGGKVTTPAPPNPALAGAPPESAPGPGSAVGGRIGGHEVDSTGAPIPSASDVISRPNEPNPNLPVHFDENGASLPVVIAGGDIIDRADWDKLDPKVQQIMKTKGYDAGVQYINDQNSQADVQNRADKAKFEKDNVKVGYDQWTGEWSGNYISKADYDKLSPQDQQLVVSRGVGGLDNKYQNDAATQNAALDKLKDYKIQVPQSGTHATMDSYDINAYLLKGGSPSETIQTLKDAGFTQDQISQAAKQNNDAANQDRIDAQKNSSPTAIAKYAATTVGTTAADMLIPGLNTAKSWGGLSTWQKVVYPLLDVVTLIPVVGTGAKLLEAGAKEVSVGAKIAALGGKDAVDVAAKDAATQLEGATVKIAGQRALYENALQQAKDAATPQLKATLQNAADLQKQDLALMDKQLGKLQDNVKTLNDLSAKAAKSSSSIGAKIYQGAEKVESTPEKIRIGITKGPIKATTTAANILNKGGAAAISGNAAYTTIHDWNNLSPAQRLAGIAMAALPIGGFGAARNIAEDVANPFKIPLKGIGARVTRGGKPEPGIIWAEEGGKTGGTTRLVIDPKVPPEQARNAVASLMKQLHDTGGVGKVEYAGHEISMKGTDFQKTVGGNVSFHATPMGELFKKGTGSGGAKTRMESYLEKVNKNLSPEKQIKIEATYKARNPETGKMEDTPIAAVTTPGVTVVGKEGGLYVGQMLYNKFSHMSAYGAKGQVEAGVILHDAGIDKLPPNLAKQKLDVMENKAVKMFDGTTDTNKIVEGFKEYKKFQEAENVITNGSQVQRVQNLRSKIGDVLKMNKGEYFTRDSQGRIELFQAYIEGGRTTPYTLKELYALKGNAFKNALADLAEGLKYKYDDLRGKTPSVVEDVLPTKEEKIASAFAKIDKDLKDGNITKSDAEAAKRQAVEDVRDTSAETLRREGLEQARDRALEAIRRPPRLELGAARDLAARASGERAGEREAAARPAARTDTNRAGADRTARAAPGRNPARQPEPARIEPPRPGATRTTPPRPNGTRATPPRPNSTTRANTTRTNPDRPNPPRPETPRATPPRVEPPRPTRPGRITRDSQDKITLPQNTFNDLLTPEEAAASVAWPEMGDRWYVIKPPYTQQDVLAFTNNALPAGIKNIFRGKKEAYRGIQTFAGVGKGVPPNLKVSVGFEDAFIEKPASAGKPGTIGFRPDPHHLINTPLTTKGVKVIGAKGHDSGIKSSPRSRKGTDQRYGSGKGEVVDIAAISGSASKSFPNMKMPTKAPKQSAFLGRDRGYQPDARQGPVVKRLSGMGLTRRLRTGKIKSKRH